MPIKQTLKSDLPPNSTKPKNSNKKPKNSRHIPLSSPTTNPKINVKLQRKMEKGMISVDKWSEDSQAYFLTHLHADHTKGLSSNWNKGPLFCSPISYKLFPSKFRDFNFSLIRVLEIGVSYTISVVSPSSGVRIEVHVTAIDADHCPGAVMYLFRGEFGRMLYTGDFRWEGISDRALLGKSMLLNVLGNDKIDIVYLDNTYCNPSYTFPPREVVAQQVIDIIKSHPEHDVVIAINTLGKEDLLLRIARSLKTKIWVWPERLETMHILGYQDTFTTNTSLTRIRAIPFYSFSANTLEGLNTMRPTIGIMPSGLPWMVRNTNETIFNEYIYTVPYSDHSCFEELQAFMKLFKPSMVKGIVSSSSCYIEPDHYLGHFCELGRGSEEASERVERNAGMVKSAIGSISLSRKRRRCFKFGKVCVRRVSVLRRVSRGAKIVETVEID